MGLSELSDSKFWKRIKQNDDNVNMLHEKIGATKFLTKDIKPCYFFCFIQIKNPKRIYEQLAKEKIQTNYFRYPNLIQEKILGDQKKHYPIVEKAITNMLYLPFRHPLKPRDINKIIEKLKKLNPEIIKY
jgi:dTDP-4-amino-4,6-dideoxygalactose transaminase